MARGYKMYKIKDLLSPLQNVHYIICNPFGRIVYSKESEDEEYIKIVSRVTIGNITKEHKYNVHLIKEMNQEELLLELL
jgi:hypothetical protein